MIINFVSTGPASPVTPRYPTLFKEVILARISFLTDAQSPYGKLTFLTFMWTLFIFSEFPRGRPNKIGRFSFANPKPVRVSGRDMRDCFVPLVLCALQVFGQSKWPPLPPAIPPQTGMDIPGQDLGGMPIQLPAGSDASSCALLCEQTVSCRAWAFGLADCETTDSAPRCWLKFLQGPAVENSCRVWGTPGRACQLETAWTNLVNPDAPLPDYPRPQLIRTQTEWLNLNGLWQWQPTTAENDTPPFGTTLNGTVLVPFPIESCLSGIGENHMYMFYRTLFEVTWSGDTLIQFGAVDWNCTVYVNGKQVGSHSGGYSTFSFDITDYLESGENELFVYVYDPSDYGQQPFGKQRISAITQPGGDTYTPSSGIWQTVWLEEVPSTGYIRSVRLTPSLSTISLNVTTNQPGESFNVVISNSAGQEVAQASGESGTELTIQIPNPVLWAPLKPYLYDCSIVLDSGDAATAYFGLRTVGMGLIDGVQRPLINGEFVYLNGWLDQSFWPDGLYTAPTDDALAFDLQAVLKYGFNFVRLHQKVNPQRWYYYADQLGIVLQQDMIQHYGKFGPASDVQRRRAWHCAIPSLLLRRASGNDR